ncbi:MAG TPA: M48 family metallopeptidase [Gemmatimonadaceae bacterium]|nr:M48 family metallopeptidase [Gemmatimonadaceae bacterium]
MARATVAGALSLVAAGCAISRQQEIAMGSDYSRQINAQLPIVRDPEVNRYISLLGDSIARVADRSGLDWHFYVVDSREVNAFAVPGGFIYVNRGLIERTTRMSQLAGVLGHEIGHVVRRHSVKQMEAAQRANAGITLGCILTRVCDYGATAAGIEIAGGLFFAKFGRDDEREADRVGVDYLVRAGIDPRGIPEMFRILLEERSRRPDAVSAWFSTHPLEEERIENAEAAIATYSAERVRGLTRDTERYQAFRRRLQSLPVAAAPPAR